MQRSGLVLVYGGHTVLAFHNGHPVQAFEPLVALVLGVPGHRLVRRVVRLVVQRREAPALLPVRAPAPAPVPALVRPLVRRAVARAEDV